MGNRLLNENFIRQRSEELQIPFENLLAASILEEIVQRIAESDCSACFWMKNSMNLKLEYYRKKVDLNLFFYIKNTKEFQFKKADVSSLAAELFRNYKKEAVHWNYNVYMDHGKIFIDILAMLSSVKVPVKIKLEPVLDEKLTPYVRDFQLFTNNNRQIKINCFPSEYVVTEKFLEIIEKLGQAWDLMLPVFIDNAESVSEINPINAQVIRLVVSRDDRQLRAVTVEETEFSTGVSA